jgi:hypothetical protein
MATVRILLGIVWLAFIGGGWCFSGGVVGYEKRKEKIATGRRAPCNDARRIIEIARKEIGVREEGCENCGIAVARYLSYCNIKSPAQWCAAWISWCFGQAGYHSPKTAWSPALFPASKLVAAARPGIVYGIYFTRLGRVGHCGIIERLQGDFIVGIEGNTNVRGSRDGDGVYRRIRHIRTIRYFSDWIGKKVE